MSFDHIRRNAQRYAARLEKQRIYQQRHREKQAAEKIPNREQMGDALLIGLAERIVTGIRDAVSDEQKEAAADVMRVPVVRTMVDFLVYRGFDRDQAINAFACLVRRRASRA